jgi:ketosteroid isomerase-like protein
MIATVMTAAVLAAAGLDAQLMQVHQDLHAAVAKHDQAALERLLADEYVFVHTTGSAETKAESIARLLTTQAGTSETTPPQEQVYQQDYGDVVVRTARVAAPNNRIWWTYVYVKRGERWQLARQHGTAVPVERPVASVEPAALAAYAGRYQFEGGPVFTVRVEGPNLIGQSSGRGEILLEPEGESRFHLHGGGALYVFEKNDKGEVTAVTVRRANGTGGRATRLPQ